MASPLLPYANGRVLVPDQGTVVLNNGRWVTDVSTAELVEVFIKRQQYSGVSSGSRQVPLPSQLNGEMMPGASGDGFYYRGYALRSVQVPGNWDLDTSDETGLAWQQITTTPPWGNPGIECQFKIGTDPIMRFAKIQRFSGKFGGLGIDKILYKDIGGVEIQLTGTDLES